MRKIQNQEVKVMAQSILSVEDIERLQWKSLISLVKLSKL